MNKIIKENAVHVWMTVPPEVLSPTILEQSLGVLNRDEVETGQRFRFDKDRFLYVTAHSLLRTVLSNYAGLKPDEWLFQRNQYGKPFIVNPGFEWLRFNLSHTHGLAACAITNGKNIGIDVERYDRMDDPSGIAQRYFSKRESTDLAILSNEEKRKRFIEIWTAKEAYIKAVGKGLSIPLNSFSILPKYDGKLHYQIEFEWETQNTDYEIHTLQPTVHHHLAVVAESTPQQTNLLQTHWQYMTLL